jgi:hypothetical protein
MTEKVRQARKREPMKSLPVRRSCVEREAIKKLAKRAGLSEARLMVTATLMLKEFKTKEELRAAVHVGGLLWQSRALSVMQVRRLRHQLERLREEAHDGVGAESHRRLEDALEEVAAVLRGLGSCGATRARQNKVS